MFINTRWLFGGEGAKRANNWFWIKDWGGGNLNEKKCTSILSLEKNVSCMHILTFFPSYHSAYL